LNSIATANDKAIIVWNYENLKLLGVCFYPDMDVRNFAFLEPYPLLLQFDFSGQINIFFLASGESL